MKILCIYLNALFMEPGAGIKYLKKKKSQKRVCVKHRCNPNEATTRNFFPFFFLTRK